MLNSRSEPFWMAEKWPVKAISKGAMHSMYVARFMWKPLAYWTCCSLSTWCYSCVNSSSFVLGRDRLLCCTGSVCTFTLNLAYLLTKTWRNSSKSNDKLWCKEVETRTPEWTTVKYHQSLQHHTDVYKVWGQALRTCNSTPSCRSDIDSRF